MVVTSNLFSNAAKQLQGYGLIPRDADALKTWANLFEKEKLNFYQLERAMKRAEQHEGQDWYVKPATFLKWAKSDDGWNAEANCASELDTSKFKYDRDEQGNEYTYHPDVHGSQRLPENQRANQATSQANDYRDKARAMGKVKDYLQLVTEEGE